MAQHLPEIYQATLPNGMNLLAVEYGRAPWMSLTFVTRRGSETDPADKPGVADWAAEFPPWAPPGAASCSWPKTSNRRARPFRPGEAGTPRW